MALLLLRRAFALIASVCVVASGISLTAAPARAAVVLNANGVSLNFNESTQTVSTITGSGTGKTAGDIMKYAGVATISSTVVDAVIETVSVTSATIGVYDGGNAISSAPQYFQSNVTTTGAGSVVYKFSFFVGGTYTGVGTGNPVTLQNVYINSYDLDASGNGSNQYTEFTGVQSYTLSTNTTNVVSSSGNLLQFKYNGANNSENYSASTGSYTKGRVQVKYDYLNTISIKVGNDSAGTGGLSYFALDFSVGLPWTEGSTTINTTSVTNSFNAPPTSNNDTKSVTASTATTLTASDFGTYADPDLNPWVSVIVTTLPTGGNLERYNGSAWVAVALNEAVSLVDIDAGNLRYTSNAQTSSDSIGFKVNDGLVNSVAAYTLAITVTGGAQALTPQVITFAQPANQQLSTGSLTVAPTADSGLTVALASTTTSVCTVSGFVITFVSAGTCSITASQPGDSTYSAATNVVRSFTIAAAALTPQVITFAQPANQQLSTGSLTVAPTADSGLTVALASTTTSVCTVSGFVITFVSAGTCSITASQPGDSTYSAATNVVRSFTIAAAQANPPVVLPAAPDIDPVSGKTSGTNPLQLSAPLNRGVTGTACLVDPADQVCKASVFIVGKGRFTLQANGQTTFVAEPGFFGTVVVQYRITDGYGRSDEAPISVTVLRPLPGSIEGVGGTTLINTSITVAPSLNWPSTQGVISLCLVDPADSQCKSEVMLPGKGTFVLNADKTVTFVPAKGFLGDAQVQLRATDELGNTAEGPVKVKVTNVPGAQNGSTKGTAPVVLTPQLPIAPGSDICLVDPSDAVCKSQVTIPGVGTWTQSSTGSVRFVAAIGFTGTASVLQRFTRASLPSEFTPYSVVVSKSRGPVTITISGFADGKPNLTSTIKARINAFLRAHPDYKNVQCIGYTEGPTVLATDAWLSRQRAINACSYVKTGLGKALVLRKLVARQGTIEADKYRRITITLTD